MKKLIIGLLSTVVFIQLYSCKKGSLLDPKPNSDLNLQTTFADSSRTVDFLAGLYSDIYFDFSFNRYNSITAGTAESSDEAHHRLAGITQPFVINFNGSLAPTVSTGTNQNPYTNTYSTCYTNIRRSTIYLAEVDRAPLSASLKTRTKAEARFLRAWYYSLLIKNFGGVPLLGNTLFGPSDIIDIPRNSYEDCVNYIVAELDAASNDLPLNYTGQNYGRITKGACLALKSRVLLYAASPLFNGGNIGKTDAQRKVVGYDAYDEQRWVKAAQAAKAVIDLGVYSLYEDNTTAPGFGFSRVFLMRVNPEYILEGMTGPNKRLEGALCPPSRGVGTLQTLPTQNLADAFGMINGKALDDPASGYNPNNPYVNRDPRFNYTFIYNGTLWLNNSTGTKTPVNTYVGAPQDGYGTIAYSTGYFWRKMMDDNVSNNGGPQLERCWPLIRYAEILLNYAEASNESGDINTAYEQLKLIRRRAGIQAGTNGLYGLNAGMSKEDMRRTLYRERQVELAYEDHRFWDVRRWKTAIENQNVDIMAMKITRTGTNLTYEKVPVNINSRHVFTEKNYFFPLAQDEISKDPNLIQNPGY
jgi:hypothetical protein